jgi:hypothetical protein
MVTCTCNPSIQDTEAGGSQVQVLAIQQGPASINDNKNRALRYSTKHLPIGERESTRFVMDTEKEFLREIFCSTKKHWIMCPFLGPS